MSAFAIDFRSLRLFRFGLGAAVLLDILFRLPDFTALHTDAGVLPSSVALAVSQTMGRYLSLFYISDSIWWAGALFALTAASGALLMANIFPRLVSVAAFVLMLSLHQRNFMIGYGGDDLMRLALIWSAFLPSGPRHAGETSFSNAASMALFVQIFTLYFCAGMSKSAEAWVHFPRGAFMALNGDTYARPAAALLLQFPGLLAICSIAVFVVERVGWVLFFSPWKADLLRTVGCAVFILMHISFGFFLHLELFPLIDVTLLLALLPTGFWERLKVAPISGVVVTPRFDKFFGPAALTFAALMAYLNIAQIPQIDREPFKAVKRLSSALSLAQAWSMFAPIDNVADGYHRIIGRTQDGRSVDLLNGKMIDTLPPTPIDTQSEQRGFRWTRFLDDTFSNRHPSMRENTINYFCRTWRPEDPNLKKGLKVDWYYFAEKTVLAPGLRALQDSYVIFSTVCD